MMKNAAYTMTEVFRYDKTFEGLLCALFDAYARHSFPEQLIGPGEPIPLFAQQIHEVLTRTEAAERVWKGLERKLGMQIRRMLIFAWLSEEEGSDTLLLRYMRKTFDSTESIVGDFTDHDVLQVKKIAQKVAKEKERLIQFVRFQKAGDGSYFAPVSPLYNVLPLSLGYFTDRFADQRWLLYDTKRRYGYYYDLHQTLEVTLEEDGPLLEGWLSDDLRAADEQLFQERWKSYFQAVTIRERLHPQLHRQLMPRRFWKYLPEKQPFRQPALKIDTKTYNTTH